MNSLYEGLQKNNSKLNLMIRGDISKSGKIYDSIAFTMIIIFVGIWFGILSPKSSFTICFFNATICQYLYLQVREFAAVS